MSNMDANNVESQNQVVEVDCDSDPKLSDESQETDGLPFESLSVELQEDENENSLVASNITTEGLIEANHVEVIEGNHEEVIEGNHEEVIGGNHKEVIEGYHEEVTKDNQDEVIGGNHKEVTGDNHEEATGGNYKETSGGSHEEIAGGSHEEVALGNREEVGGGNHEEVTGNNSKEAIELRHESVIENRHETVAKNSHEKVIEDSYKALNKENQDKTEVDVFYPNTSLSVEDNATFAKENVSVAKSNTEGTNDASNVEFQTNIVLKREILDDSELSQNSDTLSRTYIEDFIYPRGSCNFIIDSDSTSNDSFQCVPLKHFPKIAKAVERADYETLQELYQLLYLRNAWDTESILVQRILEFSGFNCELNSEDYYTREVKLHTMPEKTLENIRNLLFSDDVKTLSLDIGKGRLSIVSKIMAFLYKPKIKKKRRSRPAVAKQNRAGSSSKPSSKVNVSKGINSQSGSSVANVTSVQSQSGVTEAKKTVKGSKPGPLSSKKQKTCSVDEILKLEKEFKKKLETGNAIEPKVELKRTDLSSFAHLFSGNRSSDSFSKVSSNNKNNNAYLETNKNSTNEVSKTKSKASKGKSEISKKQSELSKTKSELSKTKPEVSKAKPEVSKTKLDVKGLLKSLLQSSSEAKTSTPGNSQKPVDEKAKKKLKDFAQVFSSIEGTPDELLGDVHYLLFLKNAEAKDLKENILLFDGLTCDINGEDYKKRKEFLEEKSEDFIADISRALFLILQNDKDANISHILAFLKNPDLSYIKQPVIAPDLLSDSDLEFDDMSDSDDSITCEVVPKKVECIDLISSGEDSDNDTEAKVKQNTENKPVVKVEPKENSAKDVSSNTKEPTKKRTLRDFETITKIVNTHPNEYLVDIYNLLYMSPHEPSTLRKRILDFSGFEFEKGSSEYIKRKQFLDRMLYNSVRRIYNTLIHNTREVKVFSKPTMIGEIFQFLFKLPDTDTSILPLTMPTTPRPAQLSMLNQDPKSFSSAMANVNKTVNTGFSLPNQSQKLSELKRVFQRVACFPCEYLIDVHKLLFMTDCDMKDIRSNIFGFKGFSFGVDSPEFNQRKMYLEYLTFHSLRKISSVLTTKTVDLRNSTKHELASHLTQVLAEYTNTYFETEPMGSETTETATLEQDTASEPADDSIEKIVVTPIIEPLRPSPTNSPEPSTNEAKSKENSDVTVSSSTFIPETPPKAAPAPVTQNFVPVTSTSISNSKPSTSTSSRGRGKRKQSSSGQRAKRNYTNIPPITGNENIANAQFPDVNLPEVEKYSRMYNKNILLDQAHPMRYNVPGMMQNMPPNYLVRPGVDQVPTNLIAQPYPHMVPQTMTFPVIHTFPQSLQVPGPPYAVHASQRPQADSCYKDGSMAMPVECVLSEDSGNNRSPKKLKLDKNVTDKTEDCLSTSSSLQMKIRDAMTKASDDEEDCDKPLATLVGHPNDKVLRQQICDIVEQTDLQEITMNGVIQKIFNMYPQYNLNYRKEFIKSTLRSLLYRLGEEDASKRAKSTGGSPAPTSRSPDCAVSTTDTSDGAFAGNSPPLEPIPEETWKNFSTSAFQSSKSS